MKYDFEVYKKNHLEYYVIVIGATRIPFYFSKSGIFYDYHTDPKYYKKILKEDCPDWLTEKIEFLLNDKEDAEIKFQYFQDGFWKTGLETVSINYVKNDEQFHERAEKEFLEKNSGKYNLLKIICVKMA